MLRQFATEESLHYYTVTSYNSCETIGILTMTARPRAGSIPYGEHSLKLTSPKVVFLYRIKFVGVSFCHSNTLKPPVPSPFCTIFMGSR